MSAKTILSVLVTALFVGFVCLAFVFFIVPSLPFSFASSAASGSFAFVNQPWDWIEGRTAPGSTVALTLVREGSSYATARTTAGADGWFAVQFVLRGQPVDILEGDQVTVQGGGLSANIDVVAIQGVIDVVADNVSGQIVDGVFPASVIVGVGRPADTTFTTRTVTTTANGLFSADFAGEVDIQNGYVAKVWYVDPHGNQVRKILYSDGLDTRVQLAEDLVEGVSVPGTIVEITVTDRDGIVKGTALARADRTGHYRTQVFNGDRPIDIVPGDKIAASAWGQVAELADTVRHTSRIDPSTDTVSGKFFDGSFPAACRVDLWHAPTGTWHSQEMTTDASGNYEANFTGVVDVGPADRIRVWYITPQGNQIASVASSLEIGASATTDRIWGYTTPGAGVEITVYWSPSGNIDGTAAVSADDSGFFETRITDPIPLDIRPGHEIKVVANDTLLSLFVLELVVHTNLDEQTLAINAPPGATLHVELSRPGAYTWQETVVDEFGRTLVEVGDDYDLQLGDRLDLTAYQAAHGTTIHQVSIVRIDADFFLPIIFRAH